ncbi:phosphoribosylanthranilate isomerase [Candidatus Pelagibacter bacterium]|nr:phosphoribosylanthranilate isomerase [Candidatus Pelagibacter bacterium]
MKLKICGLSNLIEVETCVANQVDYCGFILNYPKSHRFISLDKARYLTKIEKENSKYVGVLVKPTYEEMEKFSKLNLDYFQLYGDFKSEELIKIKNNFKKKIITSIQVKKKEDIYKYKLIEDCSDIILWDSSGYEESLSWDYNWIKTILIKIEKMVAGNITIDKIQELKGLADTIDVSGALETNKVKDINKIKRFITEVKKTSHAN